MTLNTINPHNNQLLAQYQSFAYSECCEAVEACHLAHLDWRSQSIQTRAKYLEQLASQLAAQKEVLAISIVFEMGKPIRDARAEIEKCISLCHYLARNSESLLADEYIETDATKSYVSYQPLGVVLGIMPWNFPVWQVMRYLLPALMAGNGSVLKHANNVTGTALLIEQLFKDAQFPPSLFRNLIIDVPDIKQVIAHPLVKAVSFTGSVRAGKIVAAQTGGLLKKSVLELGGSDPFVILKDAELDAALEMAVRSRLLVSGQVCISPKRIIVNKAQINDAEILLKEKIADFLMGDPMSEQTDYGPLARIDLKQNLQRQITMSEELGAVCLTAKHELSDDSCYYPATLLSGVKPGMPAYQEELFGPVLALIAAEDDQDAIRIANDTDYGLGATLVSTDVERAEAIARDLLQAGCCFVNTPVRSDPRLPFGGIKSSGLGREMGELGIKELTNVKTVYIK